MDDPIRRGGPRLAVTGASGRLGRGVADELMRRVDPAAVILVSRTPERLSAYAARGAQVRAGDFDDPASLDAAFAGADRLLIISTDAIGRRVAQHEAAVAAAVRAGVPHVVYTSVLNATEANPSAVVPEHLATERLLAGSGLAVTLLRESIYADLQVADAQAAIATGRLLTNAGEGRIAHVARADLAATAAAVLATPGHEGAAYDVTGPEALDPAALAALYGAIGGRPVEPVPLDDDAYVAALVDGAGVPESVAEVVATTGRAIREGWFDVVSDAVPGLAGRPATPLRDVLEAGLGGPPPAGG